MPTLMGIIAERKKLAQSLIDSGGELTPEMDSFLCQVESQLIDKVDNYAVFDESIDSEIEFIKKIEKDITTKRRHLENVKKSLKERIKFAMQALETNEVRGDYYYYKLARSKPKLIINDDLIPKKYKKEIISIEIDKKMIEDDLNSGLEVLGARFEEQQSLRKNLSPKNKG